MARAGDPTTVRVYRLSILSRTVVGIAGSYALAVAASFAVAALLGGRDGVQLGVMIGFVVFAVGAIWAFATRSAARAWTGIAGATAFCGLVFVAAGGLA